MLTRQPVYTGPERRKSRRWKPRRGLYLAFCLVVVGICYAGAAAWLMTQETRLVFQASQTLSANRPTFGYEQIDIPRPDGARQFGWIMRRAASDDGPWALYLHGNASTIASPVNISRYRGLLAIGLNVMAPEYRGFAGLDGRPTEPALADDARAAYDYLRNVRHVSPDRLVVYGWSLGAAVAVRLAADVQQSAVVLEGAPASLVDIRQKRYPLFPIRLITRNPFEAIALIDRVSTPVLFVHSPEDEVVPISEGRRLYDAARGPKTFVEVKGGHFYAADVDREHLFGSVSAFLAGRGTDK